MDFTKVRLSKRMKAVEDVYDLPLEWILRMLYYDQGHNLAEMETVLGVPAKTIHGWMVRLGINPQRLAQQKAAEMGA